MSETKPDPFANLPRYTASGVVQAAKIKEVEYLGPGMRLTFEDDVPSVEIEEEYFTKGTAPEAGWYLLRYADGKIIFQYPDLFEARYTRI